MRQFKRTYELLMRKDNVIRSITGLRLKFEIKKSLNSTPNLAQINVYNPNANTRNFLESDKTYVTLNVGYGTQKGLIFTGKVRNCIVQRQGVDTVATIYSGDGQKDWENSIINKTYSEGVSVRQVVNDLIGTFKETAVGDLLGLDKPADKLRGQTLSGSTKDIFDTIAKDYGFEWSIQDGAVVTIPPGDLVRANEAVLIRADTGMIGEPTITQMGAEVTALLNPQLKPNRLFRIESINSAVSLGDLNFVEIKRTNASGDYKVYEVIHKGDTHDNEWTSLVKGIAYARVA